MDPNSELMIPLATSLINSVRLSPLTSLSMSFKALSIVTTDKKFPVPLEVSINLLLSAEMTEEKKIYLKRKIASN